MIRPIATLLSTLRDVLFSTLARGDLLYRGAAKWQNLPAGTSGLPLVTGGAGADPAWGTITASTVSDLTEAVQDAVAAMLVEGTNVTLTYDDGTGTITIDAAGGGGGGGALDDLSDVTLTSPADGHFLRFNGTAWVNAALTSGDIPDLTQYALLAGRATGQTLIGGTGTTDTLTLRSNSSGTKAFLPTDPVKVDATIAYRNLFTCELLTGGSFTGIIFEGASGSSGGCAAVAYTSTTGAFRIYVHNGGGNFAATDQHFEIDQSGNLVFGKAVTTAATNGFPYVSTCPGVPTGTPATKTGTAAFVVNSTNGILYVNAGSGWVAQNGLAALTPTKGNLVVGNGTAWVAVGVGTNDHVLTADSAQTAGLKWAAAPGSGGGLADAYDTVTDGTNTATASGGDTLTFTPANNRLTIAVTSAPDTITFTVNEANLTLTASQISDLATEVDALINTAINALTAGDIPDLSAVYSVVSHDHTASDVTDFSTAADTRITAAIGSDVQAWDANLDQLAALTPTKGNLLVGNGSAWIAVGAGTDDDVLTADAAQTAGLKWAAPPGAGGGLADAYDAITDGTNTSSASGGDTLTLTSANNLLTIVVSGAPDTATFTVNQANLSITASQVSDFSTAADLRIAAAVGVSVQAFDSGLSALAAFNTSAFLVQTAANTFAGRTLTGTSNRITVTNGSGVAANPAFDIAATYVGQTSITTLGTITTGTWTGTTIAVASGGTGATSASGARTALGLVIGTDVLAPAGSGASLTGLKSLVPFRWNLAAGTPATTGTGKTANLTIPYGGTIVRCTINARTAPSGQALIVDINLGGTSIWASTQANRIQLAAGATAASQTSFDTTAVSQGDVLTIDIDQVGSGTAGQDVVVELWALLSNP